MPKDDNARLRDRSNSVDKSSALTAFFYDLLRDHMTIGVIEPLISEAEKFAARKSLFSNGWLASYAADIAERLRAAELEALEAQIARAFSVFEMARKQAPEHGEATHFRVVMKMFIRGELP